MLIFAVTSLLLTPWKGADLPTATTSAVKYELTIKDAPGASVHLRATRVANGWIAAFCDHRVCSPDQLQTTIPASGNVVIQFELIREEDSAPRSSGAVIVSDSGKSITVPERAHK